MEYIQYTVVLHVILSCMLSNCKYIIVLSSHIFRVFPTYVLHRYSAYVDILQLAHKKGTFLRELYL